jgi:hypothetical protein
MWHVQRQQAQGATLEALYWGGRLSQPHSHPGDPQLSKAPGLIAVIERPFKNKPSP